MKSGKKVVAMLHIPSIPLRFSTKNCVFDEQKYIGCINNITSFSEDVPHTGGFANPSDVIVDMAETNSLTNALRSGEIQDKKAYIYLATPESFGSINERFCIYTGEVGEPNFDEEGVSLPISHYSESEKAVVLSIKDKFAFAKKLARSIAGYITDIPYIG